MFLSVRSPGLSLVFAALFALAGCGGGASQSNLDAPSTENTPAALLAPPDTVSATPDNDKVMVSWAPVAGAVSYTLYVSTLAPIDASNRAILSGAAKHEDVSNPYMVPGLSRGQDYYVAVTAVYAQGESPESVKVPVRLPVAAEALATGAEHSCALLVDGRVRCWGRNDAAQLGSVGTSHSVNPVTVPGISAAKAISAAWHHSCAVLADGSVQCWGTYSAGTIPTTTTFAVPTVVAGINNAVAVVSARNHDCALLSDATVTCWVPTPDPFDIHPSTFDLPSPVPGIVHPVVGIAAGTNHACALLGDGSVTCWSGAPGTFGFIPPRAVPHIAGATALTARGDQTCALMPAGARCWTTTRTTEMWSSVMSFALTDLQNAIPGAKSVAVGTGAVPAPAHYFAIMADATVQMWGVMDGVPVVAGTDISTLSKAAAAMPVDGRDAPLQSIGRRGVAQTMEGGDTSGSLWSTSVPFSIISMPSSEWSTSVFFPAAPMPTPPADPTSTPVSLPVLVADLKDVAAMAHGDQHGCALLLSGDVKCWGYNAHGQVGSGTIDAPAAVPVLVGAL